MAAHVGALRLGEARGPAGAHARAGTGLGRLSGARRAGRGTAHAPDLRDPAAPLRRSESQGRLRAPRKCLARFGEGRLGNPGGQDPIRQNGRVLTARGRVRKRRAAMVAGRISAGVPGGLTCRLAGLDGLVHADLRRARHPGDHAGRIDRGRRPLLEDDGPSARAALERRGGRALARHPVAHGEPLPGSAGRHLHDSDAARVVPRTSRNAS